MIQRDKSPEQSAAEYNSLLSTVRKQVALDDRAHSAYYAWAKEHPVHSIAKVVPINPSKFGVDQMSNYISAIDEVLACWSGIDEATRDLCEEHLDAVVARASQAGEYREKFIRAPRDSADPQRAIFEAWRDYWHFWFNQRVEMDAAYRECEEALAVLRMGGIK